MNFKLLLFIVFNSIVFSYCNKNQDNVALISPPDYISLLGKGMDVDWSKTTDGMTFYNQQTVVDFKKRGFAHVRIRIKNDADMALFQSLDKQIEDCLKQGLIPIIAYQADEFKNLPSDENLANAVAWWQAVAEHYQNSSPLVSFDLIIEVTDSLNKRQDRLNEYFEKSVTAIRATNPGRILFISPVLRSDPLYLRNLTIPTQHNGYLLAEWHFYAAGPSKTNAVKQWTTGTESEKKLVADKIQAALDWQQQTGIATWVGAWMPGNYNDENDYSIAEQIEFAGFMSCVLSKNRIPFSINSDTKFYDRQTNQWIEEMSPVLDAILNPDCK